jgi:hypothetical protein
MLHASASSVGRFARSRLRCRSLRNAISGTHQADVESVAAPAISLDRRGQLPYLGAMTMSASAPDLNLTLRYLDAKNPERVAPDDGRAIGAYRAVNAHRDREAIFFIFRTDL